MIMAIAMRITIRFTLAVFAFHRSVAAVTQITARPQKTTRVISEKSSILPLLLAVTAPGNIPEI